MGLFDFFNSQLLKNIDYLDKTKDTIVYKYPMEGRKIMIGSKLTVRESQVAVFMVKGKIADVFTPGIHNLVVNNLPIISALLSWPRGFKSPFTCDIFFINTKQFAGQKWGTTSPVIMRDREFGSIRIKSYGSFAFKVTNPTTFIKEICGTNSLYTTEDIIGYLKSMIVSGFSDNIAESGISALDLACNLLEFSESAKNVISSSFESLGLTLTNFVVENISFPEEVEKAIDTRSSMGVLRNSMDDLIKYKSAEAIGDAARNSGTGGLGASLGTGLALGEMIRQNMNSREENKPQGNFKFCSSCGAKNSSRAKYCIECGKPLSSKKVCPKCNAEVRSSAKFCAKCGAKLD